MNKKRGYYTIEVAGEKITGHFSVNFWALLEEELKVNSLAEAFLFMKKGIGMKEIRSVVYCSVKAYSLEDKTFECPFGDIYECGLFLENFTEDHLISVMEAFAESKVLGNDYNFGIPRQTEGGGEEGK